MLQELAQYCSFEIDGLHFTDTLFGLIFLVLVPILSMVGSYYNTRLPPDLLFVAPHVGGPLGSSPRVYH
jgi:hypothetical protein